MVTLPPILHRTNQGVNSSMQAGTTQHAVSGTLRQSQGNPEELRLKDSCVLFGDKTKQMKQTATVSPISGSGSVKHHTPKWQREGHDRVSLTLWLTGALFLWLTSERALGL